MPKRMTEGQYSLTDYQLPEARIRMCKGPDTLFSNEPVSSPERASRIVGDQLLKDADREMLIVIPLDNKLKPICYNIVSIGTINAALADPIQIIKPLVLSNAGSFLLMHCHPSGVPMPSQEDESLTDRMVKVGQLISAPCVDHIIYGCGTGEYFSFREHGLIEQNEQSSAAEKNNGYIADETAIQKAQSYVKLKSVDQAVQEIKSGVQQFLQSDKWKQILDTFGRFHSYSLNNSILIAMQNPAATRVASFSTWKRLGRYPEKGQHGMKIICPAPYKRKEEKEVQDPQTGEKRKELVEVSHMAFTLGTVFDVSQTAGKPLPEIAEELQGEIANKDLIAAAKQAAPPGISVVTGHVDGEAKGYFSFSAREIRIREGMSEQQTLKTLIHETAHAVIHDPGSNPDAERYSRQEKEIQAESVAYAVCRYYGIDASDYSFPYIASWAGDAEKIMPNLEIIKKCSSELINQIDRNLAEIRIEKQTDGVYKTEYGYLDMQRNKDGSWRYNAFNRHKQPIFEGVTEQQNLRIDRAAAQINMMHGYAGTIQLTDPEVFRNDNEIHLEVQHSLKR